VNLKKKIEDLEKENEDRKDDNEILPNKCKKLKQEYDYELQQYISCKHGVDGLKEKIEALVKDNNEV